MEEMYVCWIHDYDISYPIGIVEKDGFEDFIKSYEEKYVNPLKTKHVEDVEIIKKDNTITWVLRYDIEYTKKLYPMLSEDYIKNKQKIDKLWGCNYNFFYYNLLKINELY